jgi:hypothetical protein
MSGDFLFPCGFSDNRVQVEAGRPYVLMTSEGLYIDQVISSTCQFGSFIVSPAMKAEVVAPPLIRKALFACSSATGIH